MRPELVLTLVVAIALVQPIRGWHGHTHGAFAGDAGHDADVGSNSEDLSADDAARTGLQQMQGKWRLVEMRVTSSTGFFLVRAKGESTIKGDQIETTVTRFEEERGTLVERTTTTSGTIVIGKDDDRDSLDIKIAEPKQVLKGIFRIHGNRLERAYAIRDAKRPVKFKGPDQIYSVWEREKPSVGGNE